MLVSTTK